jgi:hypothetical protein
VLSADPQITRPRDWVSRRLGRVVGLLPLVAFAVEQTVKFGVVEPEEAQIHLFLTEGSQLGRKHLLIPTCVDRDLIVRNH